MVVSGPVGRCVVANDAIACQFARMTFAVVNRENAQIVVRRGRIITQRVDVTDGVNEVWITPYDWEAAKHLLDEAGWLLPSLRSSEPGCARALYLGSWSQRAMTVTSALLNPSRS